jgi:hypothetical protein
VRSCRVSRYDQIPWRRVPHASGRRASGGGDGTVASGDGEVVRSDYDSAL